MPLVDIEISIDDSDLPDVVAVFLREADLRVSEFLRDRPLQGAGFVPSNFATVYHALRAITAANLAPGNSLCEWGSGFGVVASLAAMLGFTVYGIEIERDLVDASRSLADDFGLSAEFVHGSFVPWGCEAYAEEVCVESNADSFWLVTEPDEAYDELGLDPDDFDIIFAYPWPGEEHLITGLFEQHAAAGALLLMYNQFNSVQLRRKVSVRARNQHT